MKLIIFLLITSCAQLKSSIPKKRVPTSATPQTRQPTQYSSQNIKPGYLGSDIGAVRYSTLEESMIKSIWGPGWQKADGSSCNNTDYAKIKQESDCKLPNLGSPIVTDWVRYTKNETLKGGMLDEKKQKNGSFSERVNLAWWRRVGDTLEVRWHFDKNAGGSNGHGTYWFPLPEGLKIDHKKSRSQTSFGGENGNVVGYGKHSTSPDGVSVKSQMIFPIYLEAKNWGIAFLITDTSSYNVKAQMRKWGPKWYGLTDTRSLSVEFSVPIKGWANELKAYIKVNDG